MKATDYITTGMFIEPSSAEVMLSYLEKLPNKGRLLEIGTGAGHSTLFFAKSKPQWTIYTVDAFGLSGDGRVYKEYKQEDICKVFDHLKEVNNVIHILGDSHSVPWELSVDFLFIDGGHYYDSVKADFLKYSPFSNLIAFHDYQRVDFGVKQVVEEALEQGWKLLFEDRIAIIGK